MVLQVGAVVWNVVSTLTAVSLIIEEVSPWDAEEDVTLITLLKYPLRHVGLVPLHDRL